MWGAFHWDLSEGKFSSADQSSADTQKGYWTQISQNISKQNPDLAISQQKLLAYMAIFQQSSLVTTFISLLILPRKILPITWDRIQLCQRLMYSSRTWMSIHHFSLPFSSYNCKHLIHAQKHLFILNEEGGNTNFLSALLSKSWSVLQPIHVQ